MDEHNSLYSLHISIYYSNGSKNWVCCCQGLDTSTPPHQAVRPFVQGVVVWGGVYLWTPPHQAVRPFVQGVVVWGGGGCIPLDSSPPGSEAVCTGSSGVGGGGGCIPLDSSPPGSEAVCTGSSGVGGGVYTSGLLPIRQ